MTSIFRLLPIMLPLFLFQISLYGCRGSESNAETDNKREIVKPVNIGILEVKPTPIHDILILPGKRKPGRMSSFQPIKTGVWIGSVPAKEIP